MKVLIEFDHNERVVDIKEHIEFLRGLSSVIIGLQEHNNVIESAFVNVFPKNETYTDDIRDNFRQMGDHIDSSKNMLVTIYSMIHKKVKELEKIT